MLKPSIPINAIIKATTLPLRFLSTALCMLWLVAISAHAQANASSQSTITFPAVPANVPYSEVAKLKANRPASTISYGELPQQKIYYWPALGIAKTNTLVFVHGGCWLEQFDIQHSLAFTTALSQQGFNVYSIEYRRTGNGGEWPVALNDVNSALVAIKAHLVANTSNSAFNQPVSLLGHSAGGHLATLAAIHNNTMAKGNATFARLHLLGLAPIIDLLSYANGNNSCQTAAPAFMGGTPKQQQEAYVLASPLSYALNFPSAQSQGSTLQSATMLVGSQDSIVPHAMAQHPQAAFVLVPNAGHFDWIHPGSPAFTMLINKLDAISAL